MASSLGINTVTENIEGELLIFSSIFKNPGPTWKAIYEVELQAEHFSIPIHRKIFSDLQIMSMAEKKYDKIQEMMAGLIPDNGIKIEEINMDYYISSRKASGELSQDEVTLLDIFKNQIPPTVLRPVEIYNLSIELGKLAGIRATCKLTNKYIPNLITGNFEQDLSEMRNALAQIAEKYTLGKKKYKMSFLGDAKKREMDYASLATKKRKLITTGLKTVDDKIGGFERGNFVIYQGSTNVGKTMALIQTAMANWLNGMKVVIITLEMTDTEYLRRLDSYVTEIEQKLFSKGSIIKDPTLLNQWKDKIDSYKASIQRNDPNSPREDIWVYYPGPDNKANMEYLHYVVNDLPWKPDLLVMDYVGDMEHRVPGCGSYDPKSQADLYRSVKEFAKNQELVFLTVQQSKRGTKGAGDTETGSWSHEASTKCDFMASLYESKDDESFNQELDEKGNIISRILTFWVAKNRHGEKGFKTQVKTRFNIAKWYEIVNKDENSKETSKPEEARNTSEIVLNPEEIVEPPDEQAYDSTEDIQLDDLEEKELSA